MKGQPSTKIDELQFLRALDKHERLGPAAVRELLTTGRQDQSGDFTPGVGLSPAHADCVLEFMKSGEGDQSNEEILAKIKRWFAIMIMPAEQLDRLYEVLDKTGLIKAANP